ncbi:SprT-like domain-containing protein [Flavivirga algicola]|uniref:SprT domain-containing protein n=1 Tax=Flavivirga algicola TaxID=2729136 RepID=A0ABX1RUW9_9FLAO|nr:SprT-like domain-containing protein [Flavivirga algicola]NMH87344.1 sprT domain-containing protein [Flavivirga algicola]
MQKMLQNYIPETAMPKVLKLLGDDNLVVKIKNERKTRHGDYKRLPNGRHQITINSNLNAYRFLITLIHEIAHFEAYKTYGKLIKPHGIEWKRTFQYLMLPFLNPGVFPDHLLPLLAKHFKNPKASSDTDANLALALKQFDEPNNKTYIFEVPIGSTFKLYNGKVFKMGQKRVKRFECVEVKTGKLYLFNPNAEVEILSPLQIGII